MLVSCPQCGREVQAGKGACPYCFAQLEKGQAPGRSSAAGSPPQRPAPARPPAHRWSWQLVAAAFISLIGVAIILLLFWAHLITSTHTPTAAQVPVTTIVQASITTQIPTIVVDVTVTATRATTPRATASTMVDVTATATRATASATDKPTALPTAISTPLPLALCASTEQLAADRAGACYAPDLETMLLKNGYESNIVVVRGRRGVRASQRSYTASVWVRDMDYAVSGYGYVLSDMRPLRESIELFLANTRDDGVVPEVFVLNWDQPVVYQESWDSMPNLIHAVYAYVAKTGDQAFYQQHRAALQRIGEWISRLDSDGDGLPDQDIFPYGYYDSVKNSVLHTYALAKFYAAYSELAALERDNGNDGGVWDQRAASLRAGFHRPLDQGGYWLEGQDWPIAWHRADGDPVNVLETFGAFEALRSGLIAPADGQHYRTLIMALHTHLPEILDGPTPMRLALGGYPQEVLRRNVDPPVPQWMLDANAPWIVGLAAPAYAAAGYPDDARAVMQAYETMARNTSPPVIEFAAGPNARYGPGNSDDGGRTWDSAAWFLAIYSGHYGLTMTPAALIVQPQPFAVLPNDGIRNLHYQGATVQIALDARHLTYSIQADLAITVLLRPMSDAQLIRVDGGELQQQTQIQLQPGHDYVVVSEPGP
jgi:hypothetical protein